MNDDVFEDGKEERLKFSVDRLKSERFKLIPEPVWSIIGDGIWLCGGAMRSLITYEDPNDFDMFFRDVEHAAAAQRILESKKFKNVFECPLGLLTTFKKDDIKIQLIKKRYYASINDVIDTFDFTATCAGTDGDIVVMSKDFIRDVRNKVLRLNKLTYPVASINRLIKYKSYGYYVSDVIIDIVERIQSNDPDIIDFTVLYVD